MLCESCRGLRFDPESGELCQDCGGYGCQHCCEGDQAQPEPEYEPAREPWWKELVDVGGEG